MMDTPIPPKPRTMAELLPGLSGILTKEARQAATGPKPTRPIAVATRTAEKTVKPLTIAELRDDIKALKVPSPRRTAQQSVSTKKNWNSSVKIKKTVNLTGSTQGKNNTVRKVLNFMQPKATVPKITSSHARKTLNPSTPKFIKPEIKTKKSLHSNSEAASILSISGVCQIEETPLLQNKPMKFRIANKENIPTIPAVKIATPKLSLRKRVMASRIPDTPLSNESWKSSGDESFIQNEKNINLIENKSTTLPEPNKLVDLTEKLAPASTPYKEYRNVNEYFNNSSYNNSTTYHDNTIMCFDANSDSKENNQREESVIVSLCDMLKKATVTTNGNIYTELDLNNLLELEKQTVNKLVTIENSIQMLNDIRESELNCLQSVRVLIKEKQKKVNENENKTVIETIKVDPFYPDVTPVKSQRTSKPCSVIKSCLKSPSYKIPKKIASVRKKVHYKSLSHIANVKDTPEKEMGDKALSVYLNMKEQMNFLTTPAKNPLPNLMTTPMVTSHHLQKQLDKLFSEN